MVVFPTRNRKLGDRARTVSVQTYDLRSLSSIVQWRISAITIVKVSRYVLPPNGAVARHVTIRNIASKSDNSAGRHAITNLDLPCRIGTTYSTSSQGILSSVSGGRLIWNKDGMKVAIEDAVVVSSKVRVRVPARDTAYASDLPTCFV